jgi:hypothetical protein
MSGQPLMVAPRQMSTDRMTTPVGAPPVASLEAGTSTSDWFERAGDYAVEGVANAGRAHRHTIERRLEKPSRSWETDEVVHTYLANADRERRFSWESPRWREPDAATQHLVEHERRFRNAPAQGQRGAIDDNLTIAH